MEEEQKINAGTVDAELQESISSLVAALGGPNGKTNAYQLGDEALECLRDLRKWLQFYDAKFDRLEVACAIANTTLVTNDIPRILSVWETTLRKKNSEYFDRIAVACLELLVPLTWPIDLVGKEATTEKFSQCMFLKQSQVKYKTAILTHSEHNVFKALIRIAAKQSLQISYRDRNPLADGVLTLICSFFRNICAINTEEDDDRSITLTEFKNQKVLQFLITLSASVGVQIDAQDTLILETLYFLLRGIDTSMVFGIQKEGDPMQDLFKKDLKTLLSVEEEMNRSQFKPTRHSRFGTMIAMNEGAAGDYLSISGQRGVGSVESTLTKLTETKKWSKPQYRNAKDELEKISYMPSSVPVNSDANAMSIVREFTDNSLDSSFNPLFGKLRKMIEKQHPKIYNVRNLTQYSYIVAWFLDAIQARAQSKKQPIDFELVGAVLNTPSITTSLELLRKSLEVGELKNTDLAHASMVCVRNLVTCVNLMGYSQYEEFRDVSEGIKARLFYDESWLNLLSLLPRTSKGKSLVYACETVATTHIVLKTLEAYSKQYTVIYVKNKHASKHRGDDDYEALGEREAENASIRVTNERKFSYEKFLMKYINENTIATYERVLENYNQVSQDSILHVFSFLKRTFAKTGAKALFYRMSLMYLLLELTDDHRGLPRNSKSFTIAKDFMKYYVQKFVSAAQKMPSLHIQTNVIMTPADAFYYDHHGVDKVKLKPPKHEWKLKDKALKQFDAEKQFAIIVAALVDSGKEGSVQWVEEQLLEMIQNSTERVQGQYLTNDREKIRMIHNDGLLRLLLRTMGMTVDTSVGKIRIPVSVDELDLIQKIEWLSKYQKVAVEFDDGKVASDFITIDGSYESDDENEEATNFMSLRERLYNIGNSASGSNDQSVQSDNTLSATLVDNEFSGEDTNSDNETALSTNEEGTPKSAKRTHSLAFDNYEFDVNVSDGEDSIPQNITKFSKRKLFVDDDDDEYDNE